MPETALDRAQKKVDAATPRPLRVTSYRRMQKRSGATYHIKRVFPYSSLILVYGVSGSGKTFFVGYAALCIASDREFLGHRVKPGLVVYLAPENPESVEQRFAAWRDELQIPDASLVMIAGNLDMLGSASFQQVQAELRDISETLGPIAVVVVDTVSQAMPGADENSSDGMTAFVHACQAVRHEFGCSVVAVHHAGKDETRGARGHSSLHAAIDTEIKISAKDGCRTAEVTKMRDGASGLQIGFHLRSIVTGEDEDGEPVTTCVVESEPGAVGVRRRELPTGTNQKLLYQALQRCVAVLGQRLPNGGPFSKARAVSLKTLREEAASDEFNQVDAKHRGTRINEAISALKANNFISWQDDWLWINAPSSPPPNAPSYRGGGSGGAGMTPEQHRTAPIRAFGGA